MLMRNMAVSALMTLAGVASAQNTAKPEAKPAAQAAKAETKKSEAPVKLTEAQARFEQIKKLAGVWQTSGGKEGETHSAVYRVTGNGSAVTETLLPGTEHEMISVYHMDGDSIVMTHYCAVGNQPRMKSKGGTPSNVIAFEFKDCTNLKSDKDGHMHDLTLTFKDDDHVSAAWQYYINGKPSTEHQTVFEMVRVKDATAAAKVITAATAPSCCSKEAAACCETGDKKETSKN